MEVIRGATNEAHPVAAPITRQFPIVLILLIAGAAALLLAGCSSPYTRAVDRLNKNYESGYLTHEDYLRFLHDAENWQSKNPDQ
jgi:hypothetical protein